MRLAGLVLVGIFAPLETINFLWHEPRTTGPILAVVGLWAWAVRVEAKTELRHTLMAGGGVGLMVLGVALVLLSLRG